MRRGPFHQLNPSPWIVLRHRTTSEDPPVWNGRPALPLVEVDGDSDRVTMPFEILNRAQVTLGEQYSAANLCSWVAYSVSACRIRPTQLFLSARNDDELCFVKDLLQECRQSVLLQVLPAVRVDESLRDSYSPWFVSHDDGGCVLVSNWLGSRFAAVGPSRDEEDDALIF